MVVTGGGNSFSLVEHSGFLRYRLTAFTHDDGFINGYLPTFGYHSCCTHVAGVELLRSFGGDHWTFETRIEYLMPFANGRRLGPRIYFGNGGPGTFYAKFQRDRDVHPFNFLEFFLVEKFGPTLNDQTNLEYFSVDLGGYGPAESAHYFRLERNGGVLTASYSNDGLSWSTAWSHDLGAQLDGLPQRVVLPGLSWAVPAGSYADYDYVRVTEAGPGPPFTLDLQPFVDTNPVGTQHCVTATVTDESGQPVPDITVVFDTEGASETDQDPPDEDGSATTNDEGVATFCYTGPDLPGKDVISAFADTNNNGVQDAPPPAGDEPFDIADKLWVLPASTPGCEVKITNGGWITAMNGDMGSFGGNAKVDADGNVSGNEEYQDHGPVFPMNLHGNVLVVICHSATEATIYGSATIDGAGSHFYRIRVQDNGQPGKGVDKYGIIADNGYASGDQTLKGGNVQVHKS